VERLMWSPKSLKGPTENAGLEFGGPNSRTGECRIGNALYRVL